MIGGIIGGIANLIGSGISAGTSAAIAKENREWNEKMWHMQNEYNTPLAQMQRLKDAGLNPNLAYGQLASSNAGSVGTGDAYGNREISQALSKLNIAEAGASIAQAVEQIKKTRAEAQGQQIENDMKKYDLSLKEQEFDAIAQYAQTHSAFGQKMLSEGNRLASINGVWEWIKGDPTVAGYDARILGSQYFYDKLVYSLENIAAGRDLKQAQKGATDAIKALRNLDIPYFNVRNRWQPWNYGIDAGVKALNSIIGGYGIIRKSLPKPSPSYNTYKTFNNYYHY